MYCWHRRQNNIRNLCMCVCKTCDWRERTWHVTNWSKPTTFSGCSSSAVAAKRCLPRVKGLRGEEGAEEDFPKKGVGMRGWRMKIRLGSERKERWRMCKKAKGKEKNNSLPSVTRSIATLRTGKGFKPSIFGASSVTTLPTAPSLLDTTNFGLFFCWSLLLLLLLLLLLSLLLTTLLLWVSFFALLLSLLSLLFIASVVFWGVSGLRGSEEDGPELVFWTTGPRDLGTTRHSRFLSPVHNFARKQENVNGHEPNTNHFVS